jgi:hypothetical protein
VPHDEDAAGTQLVESQGITSKMLQDIAASETGLLQAVIDEAIRLRAEGNFISGWSI